MARPRLGTAPMTATERSARRRQNQAARIAELTQLQKAGEAQMRARHATEAEAKALFDGLQRANATVAALEATLRDLLATAERGTIGPKYVAAKCRAALGST